MSLSDKDRATLLTPCECSHTINDHGSLAGCWICEDLEECAVTFEALLAERLEAIVARAWSEGHAAGRDYAGDGWNADAHDPETDNPYRRPSDG